MSTHSDLRFEFVLFDIGGVLFAYDHAIIVRAVANRCGGLTPDEVYRRIFESGLEARYDRGELETEQFFAAVAEVVPYAGDYDQFLTDWSRIFTPIEETFRLVESLRQAGLELGLVSNTNSAHFRELERLAPLRDLFRWHFLSFEMGVSKPDPRYYDIVRRQVGRTPERGLFIDDRLENLPPAAAAGFQTHHFTGADRLAEVLDLESPVKR